MKNTKYILLNIVTLGIFSLITKNKAKRLSHNVNTNITVASNACIDVNSFINDLGGIDNINNIESTISTLKIEFKDIEKIQSLEAIKKSYKIKGCTKSANKITFLFGDNSKAIANKILQAKK